MSQIEVAALALCIVLGFEDHGKRSSEADAKIFSLLQGERLRMEHFE